VRNADAVEAMGMIGGVMRRWDADNVKVLGPQALASERAGYIVSLVKFVRMILQVAIFGVGAYLVIDQQITPGVMVASSLIMARALAPVESAVATWRNLVSTRTAYRRLNEVLSATPRRGVAMALPAPSGRLSVERIVYVPPGADAATLKGVSFDLEAGDMLGLIGPTAAGKSTLAKLMVGSWAPTAGKVRLDGADVITWERSDFGRYVGYLPQDVELFSGSVKENIARLGEASAQAIVDAATMAGVHEMILHLSKGYETEVGDGGEILAAGQRQLIALARALLGPPRFLVLDEPNSNLDSDGERSLLAALAAAKTAGITTVIVAHRPSILELCDKMLVLRNGVIEMFGTREEVMAKTTRAPTRIAEARSPRLGRVAAVGGAPSEEAS
jgi:PrtD family type I secretion system ABC transporter